VSDMNMSLCLVTCFLDVFLRKNGLFRPVTKYIREHLPDRSPPAVVLEDKVCDQDVQVIALLQRTPASAHEPEACSTTSELSLN
jgi:hypothetical protein